MSVSNPVPSESQDTPSGFQILASRHLIDWLASENVSLGFSTYQSGKLFLVGRKPDGRLGVFERTFNRCMGLWTDTQTLWLASAYQLWRLENTLGLGQTVDGFDRQFVPRVGYTTGDVDVHDVAVEAGGRVVFISTLFSCLATVSERYNFTPLWRPKFVSKLAAEDRCHLNGLALVDGKARYVTACGQTDVVDGWRDGRRDGGCVIDITSDQVVAQGLSMPHSPRWYREKLWVLDSGRGQFGYVDLERGRFEPVAFCPGYARGLAFVGDYAVVGLSEPRREPTFAGLLLDQELASRGAAARCGLQVIDLRNGDVVHWIRLEGVVKELYDVIALPGVVRPTLLGFKTDEIRYHVWVQDDQGQPIQWSAQPRG